MTCCGDIGIFKTLSHCTNVTSFKSNSIRVHLREGCGCSSSSSSAEACFSLGDVERLVRAGGGIKVYYIFQLVLALQLLSLYEPVIILPCKKVVLF